MLLEQAQKTSGDAIRGGGLTKVLRYRQTQKSADWVRHRGLKLPKGGSPDQRSSWPKNILTEADIIKSASLAKAGQRLQISLATRKNISGCGR